MWLLALIAIIIYMIYAIRDLHKFNLNSTIIQLQDLNSATIQTRLKERSPIIVHNARFANDSTIKDIVRDNPGYIVKDNTRQVMLSTIVDEGVAQFSIQRNPTLCHDVGLSDSLSEIGKSFQNSLSCNSTNTLTISKGSTITRIKESVHDIHLLYQIEGNATLYLINPKHKDDISGKEPTHIKKWAHTINLKPHLLVSIPPNWFYVIESNEPILQGFHEADAYPTVLYNLFR
jgi:hypothetical protein